MQSTQKLNEELRSNTELMELLDVLKGIAASQFRALERSKERFSEFTAACEGFFRIIDFSSVKHPFAKENGKTGVIMVTSDEGFMGGLNFRVISAALDYPGARDAELIIIGEHGAGYLKGLGCEFEAFPGIVYEERYEMAARLKDYIIKKSLSGNFSRLVLFYPKPLSFTVQKIEVLKILPCGELFEKRKDNLVSDVRFAVSAGNREPNTEHRKSIVENIIIESSLNGIIEYLVGAWIVEKLLEVMEDSKLAEFSARTMHLEESHQVLQRQGKLIKFRYFRSRHEFVDRGMRESFSSQIIRKRKVAR